MKRKERRYVLTDRHRIFRIDRTDRVGVGEVEVDHAIYHRTRQGHPSQVEKARVTTYGGRQSSGFRRGLKSRIDRYQ